MKGPVDPRLVRRARATAPFLAALVVVGVATAALILAQAHLLSGAISETFESRSLATIRPYLPGIALVFVARAALAWINEWLSHRAVADVKSQLRADIMRARLRRPLDASTNSASLVNLTTRGLDDLDGYYSKFLPQLVLAVVVPLMLGIAVLSVDVWSAVVVVLTIGLIPFFMALIGWTTQAQIERRFAVAQRLANHFADLVAGLPTLQVFGRARGQLTGLRKSEQANHDETMKTLRVSFLSSFALEFIATLSVAIVAVEIGLRVVYDWFDLGPALFILILAPEIYLPVRLVGTHFHDAQDGLAAAQAAFDYIDETPPAIGSDPVPDDHTLALDDVSFTYPGTDNPVLAAFSMRVAPGEIVALAGPSGSGKSTVLGLVMGYLRPDEGRVTVGGTDLVQIDPALWRRQIAWVGQLPGMIAGTIADNVRLGFPDATDADVREALDAAGGELLAADRPVGDEAEGLSSGERRRVGLARALLRIRLGGADLLVLDEPTAGLEAASEAEAVASVRASGASALIVTHRERVMAVADRVIHLEAAGEVVA